MITKRLIFQLSFLIAGMSPLSGAVWLGVDKSWDGDPWNTPYARGVNWDTHAVPSAAAGDSIVINNGDMVTLLMRSDGGYYLVNGASIELDNGSTFLVTYDTQPPVYNLRIYEGKIDINRSSALRAATTLYMGVGTGEPYSALVEIKSQSLLDLGGSLVMGAPSRVGASVINIQGSAIVARGSRDELTTPGLIIYHHDDPQQIHQINFWGMEVSTITLGGVDTPSSLLTGRIRLESAGVDATWEDLWELGILTAEGKSGRTGHLFEHYFTTYYDASMSVSNPAYVLRYAPIPEPTALTLCLGVVVGVLRHRRGFLVTID